MVVDARVWIPNREDDDGTEYEGIVIVQAIEDEEVQIVFSIDGGVVASAVVDRFATGVLVGQLAHSASEAVKA